jgi:hypothetical protein
MPMLVKSFIVKIIYNYCAASRCKEVSEQMMKKIFACCPKLCLGKEPRTTIPMIRVRPQLHGWFDRKFRDLQCIARRFPSQ